MREPTPAGVLDLEPPWPDRHGAGVRRAPECRMRGVNWIGDGRAQITPDVRPRDLSSVVAQARTIQFQEPLPAQAMAALASATRERPEVGLYIYAYGGWGGHLGGSMSFLA